MSECLLGVLRDICEFRHELAPDHSAAFSWAEIARLHQLNRDADEILETVASYAITTADQAAAYLTIALERLDTYGGEGQSVQLICQNVVAFLRTLH